MFLKELRIENANNVIRKILFKKGINLIVDETTTDSKKESGNNVGKTTVIRLIDFCLGGDGKNIYMDTECKDQANKEIENFLKNKEVVIALILKNDLEDKESKEITIKRNFLKRPKKILTINDETYNNLDFPIELKKIMFGSSEKKPTFRQIIAKNIRDEKNKLHNAVKVLHPAVTQEEYEVLYYFWLGVNLKSAERKLQLSSAAKVEKNLRSKLKEELNLKQIEDSLAFVDKTILRLESRKKELNLNKNFEKDIAVLNNIKSEIGSISTQLSRLEFRKTLLQESEDDLKKQFSPVNAESVKRIYKEVKSFMPDIQKSFEDTLKFHNEMVANKIAYITEDLPNLLNDIVSIKSQLNLLLSKEKTLTEELKSSDTMAGLEKSIADLNKNHERKGRLLELQRLWNDSLEKTSKIKEELKNINKGIDSKQDLIDTRIKSFNDCFSDISNRLYGEQFFLSLQTNERGHELSILGAISGNLGTGMKKGQIAAFDLAYVQFADTVGIPCLHFIIHDQIENIHDNQINSLLTEIVSDINCQYIVPVLRDKLPADIDIAGNEILSLSQSDKLFKI
ncbi:MAG: DUF2326 domain-containing protein [Proteobacteria bacterium]|nr:DUF2326 domain-containing protein [Pseudomonadota bacterium]